MIYNYEKVVHVEKLKNELYSFPIEHITSTGTELEISTTRDLTSEEATSLDALILAHSPAYPLGVVRDSIMRAMEFGKAVIAEYAASNVLAQLTVGQIQDIMIRTAKVQSALNTGSLYVALDELALVETDETVITPAKVTIVRNKIQDYLGLART